MEKVEQKVNKLARISRTIPFFLGGVLWLIVVGYCKLLMSQMQYAIMDYESFRNIESKQVFDKIDLQKRF